MAKGRERGSVMGAREFVGMELGGLGWLGLMLAPNRPGSLRNTRICGPEAVWNISGGGEFYVTVRSVPDMRAMVCILPRFTYTLRSTE